MRGLILFFSTFITTSLIFGQTPKWVEMMNDPNAVFAETQAEFEAYFKNRSKGKATGWKQFKRWEYYMESRVDENGRQTLPSRTLEIMEEYVRQHPEFLQSNQKRNSTSGNWGQLGPISLPANGTGQPNGMGRVAAVAFHPTDPNVIFVGSASGGFWKSSDYGTSWTKLSNGLTRLGVSGIVVHPTNTDTIFIATGDRDGGDSPGYGVWWSQDGGASWSSRNSGMGNREIYEILQHPSNPNIMIASAQDRVYRTTDMGASWTLTYSAGEDFKDLAFKPGDPNIVYAASNDFYRSTDNGVTWGQITSGVTTGHSRIAIAVTAADPNYVYLFCADNAAMNNILRSTNSGVSFTNRATTPNLCGYGTTGGTGSQAWYDLVAVGDPGNRDHFYTGAVNTWESFDGGSNWSIVTHWTGSGGNPAVHADHHCLEYSPHTGDLFIGGDGGLHYSTDAGVSWTEISSGLAIAQVYKIGQSQTVKDLVINGYQDNGTAIYRNGNWITEIGGDGMECIVDYSDASVMYGALYYGDIRRSTNNGASFGSIVGAVSESGAWVTPYKLHPTDPDTMFAGFSNMWRSYNCKSAATGSVGWTRISTFPGSGTVRDVAISYSNPNVVYASRSGSTNLFRSDNALAASPTWTNLDAGLPGSSYPKDIEIDPNDPTHVYMAYGTNIYESTNAGVSWTDISGTLPGISLNTVVLDTASPSAAIYVGMDVGVYYRDASSGGWVAFNSGLPNVEITELEIYYDPDCRGDDMLRAATYGRGLWESDLRDPGTLPPDACFKANPLDVCTGATVRLEDLSAYTPTSWNWTIAPATFNYVNATSNTSQYPEVQFNALGTYTITLNATNGNGSDNYSRTSYINVSSAGAALPLSEDWETAALCGTANDCGGTVCGLVNGWTNPTSGVEDDHDWRVDENGTASAGTGPSVDFNPGTATGNYVYLEASGGCTGQTAILLSPCIDLRTAVSPEITFAYHMFGANMGELHLDAFANGVWNNDIMTVLSGDQGNAWLTRTVSLAAYAGQVISIRFRGITGASFESDMALDDINVQDNVVLPFQSLVFSGEWKKGLGNELAWELGNEEDVSGFLLEKEMPNGFEMLTEENWTGNKQYYWLDRTPRLGLNRYRLRVRDQNGTLSDGKIVEIYNQFAENQISVYPNPVAQTLNMEINTTEGGTYPLRIVDVLGKQVYSRDITIQPGMNQFNFDLNRLGEGIYFLEFRKESFKVIKM